MISPVNSYARGGIEKPFCDSSGGIMVIASDSGVSAVAEFGFNYVFLLQKLGDIVCLILDTFPEIGIAGCEDGISDFFPVKLQLIEPAG